MQVFNDKKQRIGILNKFRERAIITTLNSGDKELTFEYPANEKEVQLLKEECYIRTKKDEFVLKAVEKGEMFNKYIAVLNVEELEGKPFPYGFESKEQTIKSCLEFAFEGTGWSIGTCMVTKKRTINEEECVTAWDILQKCLKTYRCECIINSLNKIIDIHEQVGSDKGCYFVEGLNLRKLMPKSDTYDFYTRIYPIGKDGITPEWLIGKAYIDNFQYSSKIKAYVWKDERYTNTTSLIEDATAKIEEMSRPYKAFSAEVADLAKISEKYKDILLYEIGDTITLVSKKNKIREKQRIVKIIEYPETPQKNIVEISNSRKTFAQIQQEETESARDEAINISNRATKKILGNYSTTEEIETKITASKTEVELGVMHTLESYYDREETDALVEIAKGEIEFEVSKTYQTKEGMEEYYTTSETKALIDLTAEGISLEVSKKVDGNEIISAINQSAEKIEINAEKINLNGTVTANENFKILKDGSIEAKNGKFTGIIKGATIETAETGNRMVMDTKSTIRGYRDDELYNIIDMLSAGEDEQMTIDAKKQLTIRTPKLAVINESLGTEGGTAKVTKTGTINVATGVSKNNSKGKELWIYDNEGKKVVYCTLPVYLNVEYTSLTTMLGMVLTGESTKTESV